MLLRFFILVFANVLLFPSVSAGQEMYVKSVQCKLMASPNFKSEVLATLKRGEQVEVLNQKGVWVEVKAQVAQGWLSKFLLSPQQPSDEVAPNQLIFDEKSEKNIRKRASVITTAAAARGLTAKEAEESLNQPIVEGQNFDALKLMESYRPTEAEIQAFIQSIPKAE